MTDKELLELAAIAFWGDEIDDVCSIRWLDRDECIGYTHGDNQDHNGQDVEWCWHPLADDGDCARLEAVLETEIQWHEDGVQAGKRSNPISAFCFYADYGCDKNATRRAASVTFAAEVGSLHNALAQADAACGVSPGAMGSAAG